MGQLTNQYVSQSYQGLLKLANSTTGVTSTLQYVEDGLGNKIPMQVSTSSVVITGSFRGDGSGLTGITVDSGSLVTTSSFNAYTSSNDSKVNSLIAATGSYASQTGVTALSSSIATTDLNQNNRLSSIETITGSLQNQINQKLDTGSFNTYTSSNDSKVNSLISATGSYATTSSLTSLSQSIASTDLAQNNRLTSIEGVTGSFASTSSLNSYTLTSSFNSYTSSANGRLSSLESATSSLQNQINQKLDTGSFNSYTSSNDAKVNSLINATGSYATTGSNNFVGQQNINGSINVTGSVNITGNITATSASFTYVNTVYETASVIYSSGSNQLGDASNDTQTLWGTVVLPSGPLVVTGSVTATNFTGSLQGTASYATNALSASQADNAVSASQSQNAVSASQAANAVSASQAANAVSASQAQDAVSSSFATNAGSASYAPTVIPNWVATTGSNVFVGAQTINNDLTINSSNPFGTFVNMISTGTTSFNMDSPTTQFQSNGLISFTNTLSSTGSSDITFLTQNGGDITFNTSNSGSVNITGSVIVKGPLDVRSGSLDLFSNGTTVNTDLYLTNSLGGQSNIIQGWSDNPGAGGAGATQANYTGSLRITGSNNIVSMPQIRATGIGGGTDQQGYISGSGNMIMSNQAGIFLNTGSLLFPKTQNNVLGNSSTIFMNFTTSSLSGGHPIVGNNLVMGGQISINSNSGSAFVNTNAILGGSITSTQNFVTNTRPSINSNNVIGAITLNHISSSISYQNNYNNSPLTINNHLSSSNITNNSVNVANNAFLGGSTNTGASMWVSGSQSSNATRNVIDNLIGGKNIIISSSFVSSSNSSLVASLIYGQNLTVSGSNSTTVGGSAFLGRYNGLSGLEDTQNIVFAVGTGTGTSNRRTGLWITSGSLVGVSGSMAVTGALSITGSDVNIKGITQETGSFVVTMDNTGSLHYAPFSQVASLLFNEGQFAQTGTLTAASGVSGSISYDISGSVNGITLVSGSRLTIPAAGVYNIQFSAQWNADSGTDTGWAWFKKNGTNIANSNSKVQLPNNTSNIMTVNILETAAVGDYYEVAWQNNGGHARLLGEAASGNYPAIPSVITTITQVN